MINVTVHSRAFSDIVEDEMENELEDDWDPEVLKNLEDLDDLNLDLAGNEIGFVNRSAITVKPTETYFEWLRKIDPDIDEETNIEDSIYLVTEMNSKKDFQKWIKKNFEKLFIAEIDVWLDESLWPKNMTYKMFTDFFTVTFCSTITDIEDSALRKY